MSDGPSGHGVHYSPEQRNEEVPGVIIFSSRDHQVVETTANRIMEIINGQLIDKITTYDEYLESDEMARKRFTYTITESEENDD